jgi:non-ribosomal peptide synthetase-like protein
MYALVAIGLLAFDYYFHYGFLAVAAAGLASMAVIIAFQVLLERAVTGFRTLRPHFCSIYDPYFWWHERIWKLSAGAYLALFNGTPMKCLLWRALGVRMGRQVFDDGCGIPEKTLVAVGDRVSLNAGSTIQAHSLEDGVFKSDFVVLGSGVTVGPSAFVHYGVVMHDGAVLDADSFLMKGQEVPARTRWQGNPAAETRAPLHACPPPPPPSFRVVLAGLVAAAFAAGVVLIVRGS